MVEGHVTPQVDHGSASPVCSKGERGGCPHATGRLADGCRQPRRHQPVLRPVEHMQIDRVPSWKTGPRLPNRLDRCRRWLPFTASQLRATIRSCWITGMQPSALGPRLRRLPPAATTSTKRRMSARDRCCRPSQPVEGEAVADSAAFLERCRYPPGRDPPRCSHSGGGSRRPGPTAAPSGHSPRTRCRRSRRATSRSPLFQKLSGVVPLATIEDGRAIPGVTSLGLDESSSPDIAPGDSA